MYFYVWLFVKSVGFYPNEITVISCLFYIIMMFSYIILWKVKRIGAIKVFIGRTYPYIIKVKGAHNIAVYKHKHKVLCKCCFHNSSSNHLQNLKGMYAVAIHIFHRLFCLKYMQLLTICLTNYVFNWSWGVTNNGISYSR